MQTRNPQFLTHDIDITTDDTKWALPDGAIARFGRGCVNALALSPDGKYLAVGTGIGVWIYDRSAQIPIALWDTERGLISTLDFSPNGKWLATGNADSIVKVWDFHKGVCISRIEHSEGKNGKERETISRIVFSGDSQHIAASVGLTGHVYIWNAETGKRISRLSPIPEIRLKWRGVRRPLCFSDDSTLLACANATNVAGTADSISVWYVKTGESVASLKGHTDLVHSLDFSPCGQFLASCDMSGILREWEVASRNEVRVLPEYAKKYRMIPSYSPSGVLRAVGVGKVDTSTTFVWDVERGEELKTFKLPAAIGSIRFSKGTSLAFARAAEINLWDADTPHIVAAISMDISFPSFVTFSPDGQTLLAAGIGPATCWEVVSKKQVQFLSRAAMKTPASTQTKIHSVYISPSGNVEALGTCRNMLYAWNLHTHQTITPRAAQKGSTSFAFRPEELSEPLDDKLYVWDRQGNSYAITGHTTHKEYVQAAVFSPTGEKWASGDYEGRLYVWDRHRKQPKVLVGHTDSIEALAFAPDGEYLVSASNDGTVRIWNVTSSEELISLSLIQLDAECYSGDLHHKQELIKQQRERRNRADKPARPEIRAITFSPHGDLVAGGLYGEIRLWDATTYEIRRAILPPLTCRRQFALAFSPCGYYLASGAWWDGTEKVSIRLWKVATGENTATFWGHSTDIQDISFSPDGTLLASGSFDGTLLLWDMTPYLTK